MELKSTNAITINNITVSDIIAYDQDASDFLANTRVEVILSESNGRATSTVLGNFGTIKSRG